MFDLKFIEEVFNGIDWSNPLEVFLRFSQIVFNFINVVWDFFTRPFYAWTTNFTGNEILDDIIQVVLGPLFYVHPFDELSILSLILVAIPLCLLINLVKWIIDIFT